MMPLAFMAGLTKMPAASLCDILGSGPIMPSALEAATLAICLVDRLLRDRGGEDIRREERERGEAEKSRVARCAATTLFSQRANGTLMSGDYVKH